MYTEALAKWRIYNSEKTILRLAFILISLIVFSGQSIPYGEYSNVLKGYIRHNVQTDTGTNITELKETWAKELKNKYGRVNIIDEGVAYVSQTRYINSRKVHLNIAEVNRSINKNIEIIPQLSTSKIHSKSKIIGFTKENDVLIAINGTYFKQDTGTTIGALVIDGEIISGPIYNRVGLGIGKNGFYTDRISFSGEIKNSVLSVKINNINQPRISQKDVLLYTPKWGNTAPATSKPADYISIRNNIILQKSSKPLSIPYDGYVINAPKNVFKYFSVGDEIELNYSLVPARDDIENLISGGPYLLKEGKIYIDLLEEKLLAISGRNPRTAIGYTKNNNFIMVTVDGRKEGSSGVTINELAQIMKNLGCYEAINLDGGSSTVMYANGKVYSGSNIKGSVAINNVLVVRRT